MPLPDVNASRAVLIGTANYHHLEPLPAVANNLAALAGRLCDPEIWGLPEAHCAVVLDPGSPTELLEVVHRAAREATGTLLIYYAGHLLFDRASELLLTLPSSDTERMYSSVRFADLRHEILGAVRCPYKAVVLDGDPQGRAAVDGASVLTAGAGTAATPGDLYTAFTGALLRVLDEGIVNGPELLDTRVLHDRMGEELTVEPQRSGPSITVARNRAASTAATDVRPYLQMPPVVLAERVATLRPDAAAAVLAACGRRRPEQEVAAIMVTLAARGRAEDVASVAFAAAGRDPEELRRVHEVLIEIEQPAIALGLLKVVGLGPAERIADFAAVLAGDAVPLLLRAAAASAKDRPARLTELVAGLADARLLLTEATRVMAPPDLIVAADALTDAGREDVASALYAAATVAVAEREPEQIAAVVAMLDGRAGRSLARDVIAACPVSPPDRLAELITAFDRAGLDTAVTDAIERLGPALSPATLDELTRGLRERGGEEVALRLFVAAGSDRPVDEILRLHRSLDAQGRPIDALDLLARAAGARPIADVDRLTRTGDARGAQRRNRRVFATVAAQDPHRAAALYRTMSTYDDGRQEQLRAELVRRPDADLVGVVASLLGEGATAEAEDLLRAAVGPAGGKTPGLLAAAAARGGQMRTALTLAGIVAADELAPVLSAIVQGVADPRLAGQAVAASLAGLPRPAIAAIHAWFRDLDATRHPAGLVEALAVRPPAELVAVTVAVTRPDSVTAATDLLEHAADRPLTEVAGLIAELRRRGERAHLRTFVDAVRRRDRDAADYYQLAGWLWTLGERDLARLALRDLLWLPEHHIPDPLTVAVADHLHRHAADTHTLDRAYPALMEPEPLAELRRLYELPAGTAALLVLQSARGRRLSPILFTDRGVHHVKGQAYAYAELRPLTVAAGRRSTVVFGGRSGEHAVWTLASSADAQELVDLLTDLQGLARQFPDLGRPTTYVEAEPVPEGVLERYELEGEVS